MKKKDNGIGPSEAVEKEIVSKKKKFFIKKKKK